MLERPIFFDTNVLVYGYDPHDPARRQRALQIVREAMSEDRCVISTQIMQEFYNVVVRKKGFLSPADALDVLRGLAEYRVERASAESVLRGIVLQQRTRLSIWDALIVQAALDAGCATLFTEDLQNGQRFAAIDNPARTVTIVDPFAAGAIPAVHETRQSYLVAAPKHKATAARRRR